MHVINGTTTQKDYCGNVVYENGIQKILLTEDGYVDLSASTPIYYYYLKDHQGNNRVVINSSGAVQETNHYYPFGGVFDSSGKVQPYKYNGKELDTKKGLNWYDYGARQYDATLGRWFAVDPLAEKYYQSSPYNYCENNPVLRIDHGGEFWDTVWDIANVLYDIGAAVVNHIKGDHEQAKSHWEDAGADALAIVVPFVPAGTTKIKYFDDFIDLTKSSKVDNAEDAINAIDDLKIEISMENKIDRSLLNKSSKLDGAPTFKSDGKKVEIHHEGQNPNGPFKEMHWEDHRGKNNYKKNHPNVISPSKIDRKIFNKAKREYWRKENEKW